uniref:TIGR00266 family protein n=1 Tax=Candidatus Enterococcus willemsii TaxID=1857215 RepID=UPI00403F45FE
MNFELTGGTAYPMAVIHMNNGEVVNLERGAMAYSRNVDIKGKMNNNGKSGLGGLMSAIGRSITSGESMFITEATANANHAELGVAPSSIGKIMKLEVGYEQYRLNTGAYLASDPSVHYNMVRQDVSKAFFGGTGGLFVMETSGTGDILIASFGDIVELTVEPGQPLTVDNEHVLAWSDNLNYKIRIASGMFGFTSGEGIVNEFNGSGKVLIQTRNVRNLADDIQRFIPSKSS